MNVLVTGPYGRCGTAIIDHLHDREEYDFTYLNRSDRPDDHPYGGYDTVVADVTDYDAIRPAFDGQDAVIHLAAYPYTDGSWDDVHDPNVDGMHNVLEAARDAEVETFVFGSTNHVMGMYELENEPEIYYPGHGIALDHTDPVRPDSYYGTTKSFGENLGRQYVENDEYEYPMRFYALRICTVNDAEYDHPYGDAEAGVDEGEFERDSDEYERRVARMKGMWQSRRDFAHLIDCCLEDDTVEFDVFNGVSDNDRRWYSLEHARSVLGYAPRDNGEEWDEPPA
ncbi:NAD-dependent epimerase/dehydratase family protein [Halomontanus rarus]|uniref:NAD-dependent epimerase/dehydratase family protein n=1 Tax=Halomontanus rarus TaxID=3034020 RepID=UPI0023E7642E|nr:NAD(P)-dependent oxidoreductase [Halovivax sp. TS33]